MMQTRDLGSGNDEIPFPIHVSYSSFIIHIVDNEKGRNTRNLDKCNGIGRKVLRTRVDPGPPGPLGPLVPRARKQSTLQTKPS